MLSMHRIWSESGMRFAGILCCSCCRVAQRMACKREWNAQPLHETRSWEIKKNSFAIEVCPSYIMQHWSLNYAWSSPVDAAIKRKSVLKPSLHHLYVPIFLRLLPYNQQSMSNSSERRHNQSIKLKLNAKTCSKCPSPHNSGGIVQQVSYKCLVHSRETQWEWSIIESDSYMTRFISPSHLWQLHLGDDMCWSR